MEALHEIGIVRDDVGEYFAQVQLEHVTCWEVPARMVVSPARESIDPGVLQDPRLVQQLRGRHKRACTHLTATLYLSKESDQRRIPVPADGGHSGGAQS